MAVDKILEIDSIIVKSTLDRILRQSHIKNIPLKELEQYIQSIIKSGKEYCYDLIGNLLFDENKDHRMLALDYMPLAKSKTPFRTQFLKVINSSDFSEMPLDELEKFIPLLEPKLFDSVLPLLEKIFYLKGGILNRHIYNEMQRVIISHFCKYRNNHDVLLWLAVGEQDGTDEVKIIIDEFKE